MKSYVLVFLEMNQLDNQSSNNICFMEKQDD